jgi:hypothetical protein
MHLPRFAPRFSVPAVALVVISAMSGLCYAQTESATISGRVTDSSGAVIAQAVVQLQSADRGTSVEIVTNGAGIYVFPSVHPGVYHITVRADGFKTENYVGLTANVQDHLEQNFRLAPGAVSESVTVTADSANVNTTGASVSTVIDRQFVENLPLNGRSFHALIELTPGVLLTTANFQGDLGQFSANGQRASSNYFTVDGVSANFAVSSTNQYAQTSSGSLPALSAFGGTSNLISVDALQEFRIETSTYAPEFGRTNGAQVALVSRSGTNSFHGTVFEFLRNDVLDANDWFADHLGLPKPQLRQNDFGGVLGGPIKRDWTFFFFSFEALRLRQPKVAITDVPSLAARQTVPSAVQPIFDSFPLPNGPATGPDISQFSASYSDPSSLNAASLRIDHALGSRLKIFGRYDYSPSWTDQRTGGFGALSFRIYNPVNTQTATIGLTTLFAPTLSNDFRFNFSRAASGATWRNDTFGGAVVPSDSAIWPLGYGSLADASFQAFFVDMRGGSWVRGFEAHNVQRQFNIVDSVSIVHGSHQIKAGFDFRRLTPIARPHRYFVEPAWFTLPDALSGAADIVYVENNQLFPDLLFHNFSMFAQDTWRASSRLTITYGLRTEWSPAPSETSGHPPFALTQIRDLATTNLAPAGRPLWNSSWANLAPRFGLSYRLLPSSEQPTVLRAGFGIFYDLGSGPAGDVAAGGRFPYTATRFDFDTPLPYTNPPPPLSLSTPYPRMTAFDPHLKLPYSEQWSLSLEHSLTTNQTVSLTYLGSTGKRLLRQSFLANPNPNFQFLYLNTGSAYSSYNALQAQFQRRMSRSLQALVSYTWAHSLDVTSNDSLTGGGVPTALYNLRQDYGNSDWDVRHAMTAAMSWDLPNKNLESRIARLLLQHWSIDGVTRVRSASDFTVLYAPNSPFFSPDLGPVPFRPDIVSGQPLYISDPTQPRGKRLNPDAFSIPAVLRQGTETRNSIRGFGVFQTDFSLRRQFEINERWSVLFRADAFNVFNHPNFGNPSPFLDQPGFGVPSATLGQSLGGGGTFSGGFNALYQAGGPRSMQVSMKVLF